MSNEDVRFILAALPRPFSDIRIGYITPKLKKSQENVILAKFLDSRNIISSWGEDKLFTDEIKINLYRRSID